jgi:predicted GH43/DUF377 family glycosyl hydrolase
MSGVLTDVVRRSPDRLRADTSRVITQLFMPGQEGFDQQESRSSSVLDRLMALDDDEVQRAVDDVVARFEDRHRDIFGIFARHADELADRVDPAVALSPARRLLLGAAFTSEYAIEGAALCNPSMVPHPDQSGVSPGSVRFVMSVRGIGEGHRSSIGFRTGVIDRDGDVTVSAPPHFAATGRTTEATLSRPAFREELRRLHAWGEDAEYLLGSLGPTFSHGDLESRLRRLEGHLSTGHQGKRVIGIVRQFAERTYGSQFAVTTPVDERVLIPSMGAESHGMEDARFVRFAQDDGSFTYFATYTAYDGKDIRQQLLETADFLSFSSTPVGGSAAANKGLALFPRKVHGRFAALSRSDRETNTFVTSTTIRQWQDASPCQVPTRAWELLQLGNCGSPIETEAGWLVLTHGVGAMRTYHIGALLLDLEEPTRIIGQLHDPLLSPAADEQDGYVPNVVYSCGALVHGEFLVIPYGIGDAAIRFATVPMRELLGTLTSRDG